MECNWQTKHCILLSYPRGGAGKVLANTLGLSQHCVLQSVDSADWSLDKKFNFLKKEFFKTHKLKTWNDLNLTTSHLVGNIPNKSVFTFASTATASLFYKEFDFKLEFAELTHKNFDFIIVAHSSADVELHLNNWKNAKIIRCTNGDAVINKWRSHYIPKGLSVKTLSNMIRYEDNTIESNLKFDMNCIFDPLHFIKNMELLYNQLNYSDWEECKPYIKKYYDLWIQAIEKEK